MKLVCFLLSIYVTILSTVPCCSDDVCIDTNQTEQTENHSQRQNKDGFCSHLVSCGTCGGFTFLNQTFIFGQTKAIIIKNIPISFYKAHFVSNFSSKIWQPPKVG